MKLINYNLEPDFFKEMITRINFKQVISTDDQLSVTVAQIETLDVESRLKLRRLISTGQAAHIILISSNPVIGNFAWRMGATFFMRTPLSDSSIKVLNSKLEFLDVTDTRDRQKLKMSYAGGFDLIPLNDICLIEGQGNYIKIYLKNDAPRTYTARIGKLSYLLSSRLNFIKITKSLIVNINHVAQISKSKAIFLSKPKLEIKLSPRSVRTVKNELLWID